MKKLAALALVSLSLLLPGVSFAQLTPDGSGLNATVEAGYGEGAVSRGANIGAYIGEFVIQPVLGMLGVLFVLLTIYAGFLWMTAQGDEGKVKKAKDILVAAVVGAIIMASAYALATSLLLALATGSITGGISTGE